ncbi:MAG TPA: FxSxx-COOH system tetratricopeptide repeat protein, partial [Ktedonobacteraceae bacterium]|nr:FxSxx-COOH system tetratricopeptide repeat protein [Ktedonobacteraceae bacterium]
EASLTALSVHWSVPYPRNPFFTGRAALLEALHHHLCPDQPSAFRSYALQGLGGIGKTQLALEYAYRHALDYRAVFWLAAETDDTLFSSFLAIAEHLHIPHAKEQQKPQITKAVIHWLLTHKEWLLIIDNLEEGALLRQILPPALHGAVLITTRLRAVDGLVCMLELSPFADDEGVVFLLHRARLSEAAIPREQLPPEVADPALALTRTMGGLPLALDQAGAYIEQTGCSLASYLQLYRDHQMLFLQDRSSSTHHPDSVGETFLLSFAKVAQEDSAASDLLIICAFLAPEAIPEEFFLQGSSELGVALCPVRDNPYRFNQILGTALRYSLLTRQPQHQTFSMHRLLQVVLQQSLPAEEQRQWIERVIQALDLVFLKPIQENWGACERLVSHALACVQQTNSWTQAHPTLASLLYKLAYYLYAQRAHYEQAEHLFCRALELREREPGPPKRDLSILLNTLANTCSEQGKYEQAESFYQRAFQIEKQLCGPEHPNVARVLNNLAQLYTLQGNYLAAEPLYMRAITILKAALGPEHPDVAWPFSSLGSMYSEQGRYSEAVSLFQQAASIRERALGAEHTLVSWPLMNLGEIYLVQGRYREAEPLLQRALSLQEQTLGSGHQHLITVLRNLARLAQAQGKGENAETLLRQAFRTLEQVSEPEQQPRLVRLLIQMASVYTEQGRLIKARNCSQRAVTLCEQTLMADHPHLALALDSLATVYQKQGKYAEAEPLYQRALAIREHKLGSAHPETAASLSNLARLSISCQQWTAAEHFHQRAQAIYEKRGEADYPDAVRNLEGLAEVFCHQERYAEAMDLYEHVLSLQQRFFGLDHQKTSATRRNLEHLHQHRAPNQTIS